MIVLNNEALTKEEIARCNLFDKAYKYIARDQQGELFIYQDLPKKLTRMFSISTHCWSSIGNINKTLFDNVKWEDDEATPLFVGTDWSIVPVDTVIKVKMEKSDIWRKAHFAGYIPHPTTNHKRVCVYTDGKSSHTGNKIRAVFEAEMIEELPSVEKSSTSSIPTSDSWKLVTQEYTNSPNLQAASELNISIKWED